MAAIRRHKVRTLLVLGLILTALFGAATPWLTNVPGENRAMAQSADGANGEAMAPADFARVQNLRRALALQSPDLAAMGLQESEAQSLLSALKGWAAAHAAELDAAEQSERLAKAALQSAWQRFHAGDASDGAAIAAEERRLASAAAERLRLIDAAADTVAAQMTSTARAVWSSARANPDLGQPYRYAAMTSEQKAQLKRLLSARTGSVHEAARQFLGQQTFEMDLAQGRVRTLLPAVLKAEGAVLPLPVEYRDERATWPASSSLNQAQ